MSKHFCTCKDKACPLHPTNQPNGCDLCIQKCLKLGEIPSCFYNEISDQTNESGDYTYKGFVDFYHKHVND
ncbi:DUF6485 family protein [Acidaminobacter sp. JC074]|uniref:DUF6485 family protein n=1 Tax=Acidaminobacter sp. JC074 TaxID=2530199 RepID=UPI001F0E0596|nr:DUF6485 family protein [Acidaminobacter sp. JC074]